MVTIFLSIAVTRVFLSFLFLLVGLTFAANEGLTCDFEHDLCGWTGQGWIRKNRSGYETTGPSSAANGVYYIELDTRMSGRVYNLSADYQQIEGMPCLKFNYNLHGSSVEYLSYGYITGSNGRNTVNTIPGNTTHSDFWNCATFNLTSLPTTKIYFEAKTGKNLYSIIGLDSFRFLMGYDCRNSVSEFCPVYTTMTVKVNTDSTSTQGANIIREGNTADKWYIIGGVIGGVVLLVIALIIVVIIWKRKSTWTQLSNYSSSQEGRPLPPVPLHVYPVDDNSILSIAESFDRKFSLPQPTLNVNHSEQCPDRFVILEEENVIREENRKEESGYIHLPPDYPNDDYNNAVSIDMCNLSDDELDWKPDQTSKHAQDNDYLTPSVGIITIDSLNCMQANENQYESDPTEKVRNNNDSTHAQMAQSSVKKLFEIPKIPVKRSKNSKSTLNNDNDYDDAMTALNGQTSDESYKYVNKGLESDNSNKEDYLDMKDEQADEDYLNPSLNIANDDYIDPTLNQADEDELISENIGMCENTPKNCDKDDYLDMKDEQVDEDYLNPSLNIAEDDYIDPTINQTDEDGLISENIGSCENTRNDSDKDDYLVINDEQVDEDYLNPSLDISDED